MPQIVTDAGKAALQATKPGDVIVTVFSQQTAIKATIIRARRLERQPMAAHKADRLRPVRRSTRKPTISRLAILNTTPRPKAGA